MHIYQYFSHSNCISIPPKPVHRTEGLKEGSQLLRNLVPWCRQTFFFSFLTHSPISPSKRSIVLRCLRGPITGAPWCRERHFSSPLARFSRFFFRPGPNATHGTAALLKYLLARITRRILRNDRCLCKYTHICIYICVCIYIHTRRNGWEIGSRN